MKQITTIFTAVLVLLLTACNNQPKPAAEETLAVDTTQKAETKPAFTPYKAMIAQQTVKDFDKWYASFSSRDSLRKANGISETAVGKGLDNDKFVVVLGVLADPQKAKDFVA